MAADDAAPLGPVGLLRWAWTQLTSMRTALILLFALALAAIPGSLVPQRPVSPIRVQDFIEANPTLGPVYDRFGLFDVYASPWFSAIYLLLLVSLVGCIVPRVAVYVRQLRRPPVATPRHLTRLPAHAAGASERRASEVLDAASAHLAGRRFRVRRDGDAVSAERGYLREFGNIVFHLSLLFVLFGVAWSTLWGYRGSVVVVEGQAFSNNLTQYDEFSAGGLFDGSTLVPFTLRLTGFEAKFETGPVQRGAARVFRADVVTQTLNGPETPGTIEVNHPVDVGGASVHLIGHGYAPVVRVTDADGKLAFAGPVVFLPQDGNFSSLGVIKVPDARPQRLAFEGWFLPTATVDSRGPRSLFPDALAPELFLNAWSGPPRVETGLPESVYSLDKTGLEQVTSASGDPVRIRLSPGKVVDLPDGSTLEFTSWQRWTKLQLSSTPGLPLTMGSIAVAMLGLCLSLFVRPRRLWVRVVDAEGGSRVEVAGLDRVDGRGGLEEAVADLAAACGVRDGGDGLDEAAPTGEDGRDDEGER